MTTKQSYQGAKLRANGIKAPGGGSRPPDGFIQRKKTKKSRIYLICDKDVIDANGNYHKCEFSIQKETWKKIPMQYCISVARNL